MKKTSPVHPLPDRKNNFSIWVDRIRSSNSHQRDEPDRSILKSMYIRKSGKNLGNNPKNWYSIQSNSRDRYLEKIGLMEEIRLRKIESKTVNFIYTPRYAYSTVSGSK